MKKWHLTCSVDANTIDYEEEFFSTTEPHWLECQNIAEAHGCAYWTLEEVK